jgi:hypothetical protein
MRFLYKWQVQLVNNADSQASSQKSIGADKKAV